MRLIPLILLVTACNFDRSSDDIQRNQQESLSAESARQVGMPSIVNFQEKRTYKNILELRDTAILTTTYTQDMTGKLHKICDSVGFGIPYATQYTNPQRRDGFDHAVTLPQADPNGLFSPTSADGTWVLCANPVTKKVSPVYIEPRIIVSPFALSLQ